MELYTVTAIGNGYDTYDEVIGYADNEADALRMKTQAQILNPWREYETRKITNINFLFKKP